MRRNNFEQNRTRKYSIDSIDSSSHSIDSHNEKKKTVKRRKREQPLEFKDPSPKPDYFKYLKIFNKTKN